MLSQIWLFIPVITIWLFIPVITNMVIHTCYHKYGYSYLLSQYGYTLNVTTNISIHTSCHNYVTMGLFCMLQTKPTLPSTKTFSHFLLKPIKADCTAISHECQHMIMPAGREHKTGVERKCTYSSWTETFDKFKKKMKTCLFKKLSSA